MSKFQLDPSHPPPLPEPLEESHRVILRLWEMIAGLKAHLDELEEQLNTGSDNSSVPPSQDSPKKRAERKRKPATRRSKGAQAGHKKHERVLVPESEVDTITRYYPPGTCRCGGQVRVADYRPHQVFNLPEVCYEVTEHRCYWGWCQSKRSPQW